MVTSSWVIVYLVGWSKQQQDRHLHWWVYLGIFYDVDCQQQTVTQHQLLPFGSLVMSWMKLLKYKLKEMLCYDDMLLKLNFSTCENFDKDQSRPKKYLFPLEDFHLKTVLKYYLYSQRTGFTSRESDCRLKNHSE